MTSTHARDIVLLDAIDALPRIGYEGPLWRVCRQGRDPLQGHASGGRWDPGRFDVLYCSLDPNGAAAEMQFHLSREPVFPSKLVFERHHLGAQLKRTLRLGDMTALAALDVDIKTYGSLHYQRCQEIGDAACFLGFDGLIVPNARWDCLNAVIFTETAEPSALKLLSSEQIDLMNWARKFKKPR
jgi:RES domain-containing protein